MVSVHCVHLHANVVEASVNGVPSCANDYLINKVVRTTWGRDDVMVGSDCGAISNMVDANHYATSNTDAGNLRNCSVVVI